jgi:hypothetical protein
MTTDELLDQLTALGVRLEVRDGNLSIDAPSGGLTDEFFQAIQAQKAALIRLLSPLKAASTDWREVSQRKGKGDRMTEPPVRCCRCNRVKLNKGTKTVIGLGLDFGPFEFSFLQPMV